jgi:cation:H+ antiporter
MLISGYLIWRSSDGFELASDYLGRRFSKGIKGATINAVASSMPELLSTFFFLFYLKDSDSFSGGLGITGGSAIFNILIIPISIYFALFFSKKIRKIPVSRRTFMRDGLFLLLLTGFVAAIIHSPGGLKWWHGALLMAPYFGYVGYLFFHVHKKHPGDPDIFEYDPPDKKTSIRDVLKIDLEKMVLRSKMINRKSAWMLLMVSVAILVVATWMLVYSTDMLGKELEIPILFVSVILSAAASSVPDTVISIRDAAKGNYEDAFSNALGSNIFDISFALGFPLMIYTAIYGKIIMHSEIVNASSDIWVVLFLITGITLLIFGIGKSFNLFKVLLLCLLYVAFLIFIYFVYAHEMNFISRLF